MEMPVMPILPASTSGRAASQVSAAAFSASIRPNRVSPFHNAALAAALSLTSERSPKVGMSMQTVT
ncbi:hypothetical protein D3C87_2046060 [compost metagenome]